MVFELTKKESWLPLLLTGVYSLLLYFLIGWSFLSFACILVVLCAYYFHERSNRVVISFLPFLIYFVIYDSMRGFPNYVFQEVTIQKIYELEKQWFGFSMGEIRVTPNEYFRANTHKILDFLGGLVYSSWVYISILFGVYLFLKNKRKMLEFAFAFLLLNLMGITTYYLIPVAPPWYVELHGFEFKQNILGYEAGLANFDAMFNITFFRDMYTKLNSQVFAALPSLHSAFPLLTLLYSLKTLRYINILFILHGAGIWFFAVYLRHHYILDVLLGIIYALLSYLIISQLTKNKMVNSFMNSYKQRIT